MWKEFVHVWVAPECGLCWRAPHLSHHARLHESLDRPHPLLACMLEGALSPPSHWPACISWQAPIHSLHFSVFFVLSHDLIIKPTLVSDLPSSCCSLPGCGITGTGTHHIAYPLVLTNFFLASSCGYSSISASRAYPQRLSKSQDSIPPVFFPLQHYLPLKSFPFS